MIRAVAALLEAAVDGSVPVWLFCLCLSVAVPVAFVGGYYWTAWAVNRRIRGEVRRARARLDEQERARLTGQPRRPVDTTRFTR